jgi:hypothetical protein
MGAMEASGHLRSAKICFSAPLNILSAGPRSRAAFGGEAMPQLQAPKTRK